MTSFHVTCYHNSVELSILSREASDSLKNCKDQNMENKLNYADFYSFLTIRNEQDGLAFESSIKITDFFLC